MTKKLFKKGASKTLPARTIYKTQQIQRGTRRLKLRKVNEKPARRTIPTMTKPSANLKNNGVWLWVAIDVGHGNVKLTHGDKNKRVTYRLLPRAADANTDRPKVWQRSQTRFVGFSDVFANFQSFHWQTMFLVSVNAQRSWIIIVDCRNAIWSKH